jgi:sugar phosphate isomerase/epimerase
MPRARIGRWRREGNKELDEPSFAFNSTASSRATFSVISVPAGSRASAIRGAFARSLETTSSFRLARGTRKARSCNSTPYPPQGAAADVHREGQGTRRSRPCSAAGWRCCAGGWSSAGLSERGDNHPSHPLKGQAEHVQDKIVWRDRGKETMTTPRFSVIDSTTPGLSFAEALVVYRTAGADGIGITETKLRDDQEDIAQFRASGLQASSCFLAANSILPSPLLKGPDDPALRIADLCRSIRRLAPFEPDCCFIVSGPRGRYEAEEAREIVSGGLRTLARVAAEAGMTLAVELMHTSLADEFGFMHTIPDAVKLLQEVGEANTAIAIDVWHLSESDDLLSQVRDYAQRFASLHVNDRRASTRSWCDRVLPGDGIADLPGILGSLDEGGFDGWFELEILSDDGSVEHDFPDSLWKRDPLELVSAGRTQFLSAWYARRTGT